MTEAELPNYVAWLKVATIASAMLAMLVVAYFEHRYWKDQAKLQETQTLLEIARDVSRRRGLLNNDYQHIQDILIQDRDLLLKTIRKFALQWGDHLKGEVLNDLLKAVRDANEHVGKEKCPRCMGSDTHAATPYSGRHMDDPLCNECARECHNDDKLRKDATGYLHFNTFKDEEKN